MKIHSCVLRAAIMGQVRCPGGAVAIVGQVRCVATGAIVGQVRCSRVNENSFMCVTHRDNGTGTMFAAWP